MDGLVLCLDGANYKSFKGEATTNYYSTPITLTSGRTGSTDGSIKTSFNTGGPTGGPFTRVVRDTSVSRTTDWEWQIGYSGTGLSNGNSFVVSFYARCPNGTLSSVKLSNPDVEGQTFNIDSTWRRFTASFTYGSQGGLTFFRVNRGHTPFYTNGATYDIANLQVEAKSYSTSFVDGTRGTTVATGGGWKDLVGSNNGELVNGVRESTDNGGSLVFDGVNDYVSGGSDDGYALGTGAFTVETWVKFSALPATNAISGISGTAIAINVADNISWWIGIQNVSGTNYLQFGRHATSNYFRTPFSPSLNTWYHLVSIRDSSGNVYLFIDGNSQSVTVSGTWSSIDFSRTGPFYVGLIATPFYLNGSISNLRIYKGKALSAAEVKQNFDAHKGRYGL